MLQNYIIELHPKEIALILSLRSKFQYGDVVVVMHQGLPARLKQVVVFDDLNTVDISKETLKTPVKESI